jgi:hypothetical protein
MATVWFPHNKAQKAGEVFIEASKKNPTDRSLSKELLNNAVCATKEGYKVVSAREIKEGKLVEYLAQVNKLLLYISERIDGYKYEIEVYSSIFEAMDVLGLKPPE